MTHYGGRIRGQNREEEKPLQGCVLVRKSVHPENGLESMALWTL
jgi:hypothetical protein